MFNRLVVRGLLIVALSVLVACGGDHTAPSATTVPVATVVVAPGTATILVGSTLQLSATLQDAAANPLTGRPVAWATSNGALATVSSGGLLTAVAAGPITVTASSGGKAGTAQITVNLVPVAAVSVVPGSGSVSLGKSSQLTAVTTDSVGHPLTGRPVTWASDNQASVTVSSSGVVTGVAYGNATITASSNGKNGTALISVDSANVATVTLAPTSLTIAVGASAPLSATTRDTAGQTLTGRVVSWSSSAPGVATVSATGVVSALTRGTATITASSEGKLGTASITTVPGAPASITLFPNPVTVGVGTSAQLQATVMDAGGDTLAGVSLTWSSSAPLIASVNGSGLVNGLTAGSAIIAASSGALSATDSVTVTQTPVATVTVSPPTVSLSVRSTAQLSATLKDASSATLLGRAIAWSSSDSTVASVSATGMVTAVNIGTATITATSEGKTGSAAISATAEPVGSVVIAPDTASVGAGVAIQLSAVVLGPTGDTLQGRPVTWLSGSPSTATVSPDGFVTGIVAGSTTISASSGGKTGTAAVTVLVNLAFPALDGGYSHTCSRTALGGAYCWGLNDDGELGSGLISPSSAVPVAVAGDISYASLYPGGKFTCALTGDGAAWCWGRNAEGQLGRGTLVTSASPGQVVGGLQFNALAAGYSHACGLIAGGVAYCWGTNSHGELGDGTTTGRLSPVAVAGGRTFVSISARGLHTCALTANGTAYCWGSNTNGEIGDGTKTNRTAPVAVSTTQKFVEITTGALHTCARTAAGDAFCWGDNALSEIGDGTATDRPRPTMVTGGLTFGSLRARGSHTCGVATGNQAYCWGYNAAGELGDGTTSNRAVPTAVAGGLNYTDLSSGASFSCGVTETSLLYCWGDNTYGQLGNGSFANSSLPIKVLGQP
ncbi:MAG: Ig-like domain-containing protein [Gemmatimonadota bacterium]